MGPVKSLVVLLALKEIKACFFQMRMFFIFIHYNSNLGNIEL